MYVLFDIGSASGTHSVYRSDSLLVDVVTSVAATVLVTDSRFADDLAASGLPIIALDAEEDHKTLDCVAQVITTCRANGLTRDGRIAAVGGGIIQDVSCFAASVFMRGVDWVYVPTTLLSMVDSCIGGKSSINVSQYKNIAGTFHPPKMIIIAPGLVNSLPPEHVAAGYCEAAKICFAKGEAEFNRYLELHRSGRAALGDLIELSLRSKKWFIEVDEFDRAERQLLNFGHSFGHALESATGYELIHGVAVGVGMLAALRTSAGLWQSRTPPHAVEELRRHVLELLAPLRGIAEVLGAVDEERFFKYFNSDKKHSAASYNLILVDESGRLVRQQLGREPREARLIWSGFESARQELSAYARRRAVDA